MKESMKKILFANTHKYVIGEGSLTNPDNVLLALTVNRNLQQKYGMTLDASAIRELSTQTATEMARTWQEMDRIIGEVTGANDFRGQLFYPNFPEEVMEKSEAELYLNSLFYYAFSQSNDKLSLAIADEIHAMVSEEKRDRLPLIENFPKELKIVNKGTETDLIRMMDARMHSLNMSENQFEELKAFSYVYRKEFNEMLKSETPFQSKESKVKIAMMLHEEGRKDDLKALMRDSVDVLRFAAVLSYKNGMKQNTVELKSNVPGKDIAFKLTKPEKRLVRDLLNNCAGLYTDIWRQEKLFKQLMNRLGTTKADNCPVRVTLAFDNLALGHKVDEYDRPIYNPNKLIPEAIEYLNKTGDISKLESVAANRPGDFLRSYVSCVTKANPEYRDAVINAVRHCADSNSIPMKNILTVREQIAIDARAKNAIDNGEATAKVYKHHGKHYVKINNGIDLPSEDIEKMRCVLMETASKMVAGYQELGKVYIDPALADVKAPGRDMRDASGGSILTPYSKFSAGGEEHNLLMFGVRWEKPVNGSRDNIDVDLSVHMYGKNYEDKGYVSYSHLRAPGAVHSGDYTYVGKSGSSTEAIACDKKILKEMGVKYLVAEVHCFSIPSFREAGNCRFVHESREGSLDNRRDGSDVLKKESNGRGRWDYDSGSGKVVMLGEVFEPKHLENCVQLNSDGASTIPVVYDVDNDQMLWLDMTLQGRGMPHVTEDPRNMTSVMAEIERAQNNPYPDMKSLFECYAHHNGELTTDIKEADTVFVRENIDREELGLKEDARVITGFELDVISKEFSGNDDQSMVVKEAEQKIEEPNQVKEPPLLRQFRYLREKLDAFPRGAELTFRDLEHGIGRDR